MNRLTQLALGAAAAAVVVSGCASANIAATVDGVEIVDDQVLALSAQDEEATTVRAENPCNDAATGGSGQACVGFRDDLASLVILQSVINAAAADFGITGIGTVQARGAYFASAPAEATQLLQNLLAPPWRSEQQAYADFIVDGLDITGRVQSELRRDADNLTLLWGQRVTPWIDFCVRNIVVETEDEAWAVVARLDAEEDFSAVAFEVSLDRGLEGGALPCPSDPSTWPFAPLADAVAGMEVGDVSDPVETEFGWHVMMFDSRQPASYDELVSDPDRWVPPEATNAWWSAWFQEVISGAQVSVRSQIGVWDAQTGSIKPRLPSP